MKKLTLGFSLVEILVVVAIVGILATALMVTQGGSSAASRDAQRKADLTSLKNAVELYKNKYGRYPQSCNGAGAWGGQIGTAYECADGSAVYILGLSPEFINVLPRDPKLNGTESGYVYQTNAAGTVFKIMARNTVETENISRAPYLFMGCDITSDSSGLCDSNPENQCSNGEPFLGPGDTDLDSTKDTVFDSTYAVWGGWAEPTAKPGTGTYNNQLTGWTQDIVCDMN